MSIDQNDTKFRIRDATWKLLESGDKSVRMSDIAKAVGISRQALYLHFPNRTELFVATTKYMDDIFCVGEVLAESRAAQTGEDRLAAFITAWANYVPRIFGVR